MKFTPEQLKRLAKLVQLLKKDQAEFALHIFELENKFDTSMEGVQEAITLAKKINKNLETLKPDINEIVTEVLLHVPAPKDADEKKIIDAVTQEIIKRIRVPKDGKDAIVDYNSIVKTVLELIPTPKNGVDGLDGSPDTAEDIRNKLELLLEEERLDGKYIKNLEDNIDGSKIKNLPKMGERVVVERQNFIETPITAGQNMIVNKDGFGRYVITNGIIVSTTAPSNPSVNDLWVDIN